MQKKINARLVSKNGFEFEQLKATNFIPIKGEVIIQNAEADQDGNLFTLEDGSVVPLPNGRTEPYTYARIKMGNGLTYVNDLPEIGAEVDLSSYATTEYVDNLIVQFTNASEVAM